MGPISSLVVRNLIVGSPVLRFLMNTSWAVNLADLTVTLADFTGCASWRGLG